MRSRILQFILAAISVLATNLLSAQELRYRSDVISMDAGLSNGSVTCVMKDRYGFMWFGTWNGLNRYDGYEMMVFQSVRNDTHTISNSNINFLFEDRQGLLWIGTDNGLNSYNHQTGTFRRYNTQPVTNAIHHNNRINAIVQDRQGRIWIGSQEYGLTGMDKQSGELKHFSNTHSDRSNNIISLLMDRTNEQILWVGTGDGLYSFDIRSGHFRLVQNNLTANPISVQSIRQDKHGNLYLGTWGNGLIRYERKSGSLQYCFTEPGKERSLQQSIIRTMSVDAGGKLLISVWDRGLMLYDPLSGKLSNWGGTDVNNELNNRAVSSVYADPSGIVWVGTIHGGVIKIITLINSFNYYSIPSANQLWRNGGGVTAILEDAAGFLWLGTRFGGLYKINRQTGKYAVYKQPDKGNVISSNNILSLAEVAEKGKSFIWIGTDGGGLNRFDPRSGKFTVYKSTTDKTLGPGSNSISTILPYDANHLLIGTRDRNLGEGVDVFNLKTGRFVNMRHNPDDSTSLGSNNIQKMFMDKAGTVWVGTRNGGLNKFVVKNIDATRPEEVGYFVRYTNNPQNESSLSDNTIYAIHDDTKGNLWVGTNEGGLSCLDTRNGTFFANTPENALKNHLVYGILADDHQNLWISTSRGVTALNLMTERLHQFDKYDGIQEDAFIYGSYFKSQSGELFFGGISGCHSFHPDSIKVNLRVPKIVITSLNFSGRKGVVNVNQITGKSVIASKKITVPHYQNNFAVTFSALDYDMPAHNRYKYMLDGYDQKWIETDAGRRYVNYTNLPPGRYVFKVIGSNSDEIWNHEGTSVMLFITPPWWKTKVFQAFMLILAIGLLALGFYLLRRKHQHEKRMVEMEAQLSLQDERTQLRTLIDSTHDLIFIKDRQSCFTVANKRVAQVMGTTPENLIGKTDFEFYSADLARKFYTDEQRIMETGESMINCEEPALDEQGNRVIISTSKVPVRNKAGEIIGLVGICRDITKLKRIETQLRKKSDDLQETNQLLEKRQKEILIQSEELAEQTQHLLMVNGELERLNRTKDKFFSIIAHDLRNPFNAIIGFCELLRNDFHDMDNKQKINVLELINLSSQTAYNLLENLLEWARTQTDKIQYVPADFDIHEAAVAVIDLHCGTANKKGVKLRNDIAPSTFVHADRNMITTVLRNLVSNAIKFTNPGGEIVVSVNNVNSVVEVNVADNGIGMSSECLSKLFRIDTYYSSSGTMGESGTGLGLIICKEFVEKNHGRIRASSQEGEGTTLTFTLSAAKMN